MSIRLRITLVVALVIAVVMAGVVVVVSTAERNALQDGLADSLQEHLDLAQELVAQGEYQRAIDDSGNVIVELFNAEGDAVGQYRPAELIYEPDEHVDEDVREVVSGLGSAEAPFLVVQRTVESPDGPLTVIGVMSLDEVLAAQKATADILAAVLLVVLVFVVVFTWLLVGRTLAPVEDMRRQAEEITASQLARRIDQPACERELGRLAKTLNDMLDRIEQAYEQQKRFASDASHELKSPLAATAVMLEELRDRLESVDIDQMIERLAGENARMQSIVENLLMLTRVDEGRLWANRRPVDLLDLVNAEAAVVGEYRSALIDTGCVAPLVLNADAELLALAVRNVLDNAARHAVAEVRVSAEVAGGVLEIDVDDDGPGIPEEERERVFERFVRLDSGRSHGGHSQSTGLGLAVAKSVVELHDGTIAIEKACFGGARVKIRMPA